MSSLCYFDTGAPESFSENVLFAGTTHGLFDGRRQNRPPPPGAPLAQVRLLFPGQPHAFFFEALEEGRHYLISLDGVDNADARTGAFTTLKAGLGCTNPSENGSVAVWLPLVLPGLLSGFEA